LIGGSHDGLLAAAINEMARLKSEQQRPIPIIKSFRAAQSLGHLFCRNLWPSRNWASSPTQMEMLDLIGSNAEKLMSFTSQPLDLARSTPAGVPPRRPTTTAFWPRRRGARAPPPKKTFPSRWRRPRPPIFADGDKLTGLGNLLSNAVKYTSAAARSEVASLVRPQIAVTVKIRASASPPKSCPSCCRFYQATNASLTHSGTGLDWPWWFVEGHGGAISVSSARQADLTPLRAGSRPVRPAPR
jgi:hypothetical protein